MQKTALSLTKSASTVELFPDAISVPTAQLPALVEGWLLDGEIRQLSSQTLFFRRLLLDKLAWFLREKSFASCGKIELRAFLAYVASGNVPDGGRWGNSQQTRAVRPSTTKTYHGHLRTFFRWLIEDGHLTASPMEAITAPAARADQIQPFTEKQVDALLSAAKRTNHPKRDTAIISFLLDTGVRASELCSLRLCDLDAAGRTCIVLGKGNKRRSVYIGRAAMKALWDYLREDAREKESPLFLSDRGSGTGEALTRSGLGQMVERLGVSAGIEAVRCSPHSCRHTFAVSFLRAGGQVFALMNLLGHTNLQMTNRYVALAQADLANQHRQFSPLDRRKAK